MANPTAHLGQSLAPAVFTARPTGQARQSGSVASVPALEYLPAEHCAHEPWPDKVLPEPASHCLHTCWPCRSWKVPGRQGVGVRMPELGQRWPMGHGEQSPEPGSAA